MLEVLLVTDELVTK